jgi:hypothetical protein
MVTRAEAFAVQAASDLNAYDFLSASTLPSCHRLHCLQMWLEKLCKAYLWLPGGSEDLRTVHSVVAKVLPRMISEHWRRIRFERRPNMSALREVCREIDLLHPAIDDNGRRPDNVEYPWVTARGEALAPASHGASFPLLSRLHTPEGKLLLNGAVALTRNPAIFV